MGIMKAFNDKGEEVQHGDKVSKLISGDIVMVQNNPEHQSHNYISGYQAAWRQILGLAMQNLEGDFTKERLLQERSETISVLREICEAHGDNDWPDNLYIPDILRKHLEEYL